MDLPPSGWYPDPYGVPDLLRWWDGSTWTQHTHPGVGGADTGGGAAGSSGAASGGGWATRDRVIGDWAGTDWPTGDQLANTNPPKGPRTEPQPALPATSVQSAVQATTYQPAVQATTYQPAVQPTVYQPAVTSVAATTGQGATAYLGPNAGGPGPGAYPAGGADPSGTQVLFLGADAWQVPGGPGAPGGQAGPNRYGYQQAQRHRRMWLIGGLIAGTAVAIAIIVVVATSLGGSQAPSTADQAATTPAAAPTPTAAAPTATPAASPSASATPPASVLSDGQSGLSYIQLATPWQPVCPSDLDSAFSWTAGESAIAGQINGGQTAWYGEACSGPLPAQYNYSGVADLENTATNVAQTLENAYYNALNHTVQPELSQPITVSGHPGWEIEYVMNYTNAAAQGATWTTEEGAVVVTDTGTGNTPVVFFTSVPDNLGLTNVASLVSSLQLTVVPVASTVSPTASVTPTATVTPPAPGLTPTATGANP
ncbi:MAG: DUF2510 domain-containing protein [Trebonia sp.]|jgi:hypothetical protein